MGQDGLENMGQDGLGIWARMAFWTVGQDGLLDCEPGWLFRLWAKMALERDSGVCITSLLTVCVWWSYEGWQ